MVINKPEYHAWKADEVSNIDYGVASQMPFQMLKSLQVTETDIMMA
jgi:hypothetical protein